jgi:hypothetical protein
VPLGPFFASRIIQLPTAKFLKYPALLATAGTQQIPRITRAAVLTVKIKVKVKQFLHRPGQAQRVPGV